MMDPEKQRRLIEYLSERARMEFRPGKHDCAIFAAGAVQAMGGPDLARGWRGYRTMREGISKLRKRGFRDHIALARHHLPPAPKPRPGDVAVVQLDEGPALGIVQGASVYVVAEVGWTLLPIDRAVEFMRVA